MLLLTRTKSNTIETLVPKVLISSRFSQEQIVSVHDVIKEQNHMKESIKNPKIIYLGNLYTYM